MTDTADIIATLKSHADNEAPKDMRATFASDPKRFGTHSARFDDLLLDWSKCAVNEETLALLADLAQAQNVEAKRDAMFAGERINITEDRAVLHTALRNRSNTPVIEDGKDVMPAVNDVLERMAAFAEGISDDQPHKPFRTTIKAHFDGAPLTISIDASAEFDYFRLEDE